MENERVKNNIRYSLQHPLAFGPLHFNTFMKILLKINDDLKFREGSFACIRNQLTSNIEIILLSFENLYSKIPFFHKKTQKNLTSYHIIFSREIEKDGTI